MIKPDLDAPLPDTLDAVHFIGIGGSGMSGIARLFLEAGHPVTGSDRSDGATAESLRAAGATVHVGHDAAHLGRPSAVVVTSALWPDNPEYLAAQERGIPVLHRSQALAWLARGRRTVAVAGAHGKTTSTGMVVTGLRGAGRDPGFVNGGILQNLGVSAAAGSDDLFVVEADESDGSFLLYDVDVALITNIDPDHLDHYGSTAAVEDAFVTFAERADELVVISADDPGALRVAKRLRHPHVVTFGEAADARVRVTAIDAAEQLAFTLSIDGAEYRAEMPIAGRHNAINAAGAVAVLVGLGVAPAEAVDALREFTGTGRRFELHATVNGVRVYDDYAHHPTEVAAALATARSVVGGGRLIAVHQPHLYSRTQMMAGAFAAEYEAAADHTVVLDVYGAREDPIPGVTGELVSRAFADDQRVDYRPDWQEAAERVAELARPGDLVMTLSCGDVYRIIPQLVEAIQHREESAER